MSNFREKVTAAARAEVLNCLANGDFDIEHKVNGTQGSSTNWGVKDYVDDTQDKTSDPVDTAAETRPINIALVGIIKT